MYSLSFSFTGRVIPLVFLHQLVNCSILCLHITGNSQRRNYYGQPLLVKPSRTCLQQLFHPGVSNEIGFLSHKTALLQEANELDRFDIYFTILCITSVG